MDKFISVIIYLFIFSVSTALFCLGNVKNESDKTRTLYSFGCIFLAALIPSVFAGMRDDSVGVDVTTYANSVFYMYSSRMVSLGLVSKSGSPSFAFLAYLIGHLYKNFGLFLGMIQFLIVTPVIIVALKKRDTIAATLFVLLFYFNFYNYSLNIMRQSIASSFLFLGFLLFEEKKYIPAFILSLIASGFHESALLGILLFVCIYVYNRFFAVRKKYIYNIFIISIVSLVSFGFIETIFKILYDRGIVSSAIYYRYNLIVQGNNVAFSRFMIFESLFRLGMMVLVVVTFYLRNKQNYDEDWNGIAYISYFGNLFYLLAVFFLHSGVTYRVTEYFDYFTVLYLCLTEKYIHIKIFNIDIYRLLLICYMAIHWLIVYILWPEGMGFATEIFRFR